MDECRGIEAAIDKRERVSENVKELNKKKWRTKEDDLGYKCVSIDAQFFQVVCVDGIRPDF